jgi:hypothetical protein
MNRRVPTLLVVLALVATPLADRALAASAAAATRFATTVFPGAGGEPAVSVSPDGRTVIVAGLGGGGSNQPAALYRSTDGGAHFTHITPTFAHVGGGDWDMRWLDNHTIIAADLSLGTGIYVHRSTDGGLHWTDTTVSEDVYDRPWLATHGNTVYLVTKGFDGVPYMYESTDAGASFAATPVPIYGTGVVPAEAGGTTPTPAEALVTNQNAYVDHVATDPQTGRLYVLYGIDSAQTYSQTNVLGVPDRLYVATLTSNGALGQQFVSHPVYLGGANDGFINGFNWLTVGSDGTLYVIGNGLHDGHQSAWLSYSRDHGVHWSSLRDIGIAGGINVYAAIAATAKHGNLGLVYLRGSADNPNVPQDWYVEIGTVHAAATAHPRVSIWRPISKPIHTQDICMSGILCGVPGFGSNRNLLDFIWGLVTPSGHVFAAIASDGPATGSDGNRVDTVLLRQVSGPTLGRGVPD